MACQEEFSLPEGVPEHLCPGGLDVYFAYDPMGNVANTITSAGATNVGFDAYGTRYGTRRTPRSATAGSGGTPQTLKPA